MAFAGPRLDRPSAVGDEGRPRAASLTVAAVVVLGLFVAATAFLTRSTDLFLQSGGLLQPVTLVTQVALPVGITVTGVALLSRTRVATRIVGSLMFLFGGSLLVALLVVFAVLRPGLLFFGFAVSCLGVALTWTDTAREAAVLRATKRGVRVYVAMLFGLAGSFVVAVVLATGAGFFSQVFAATTAPLTLTGFGATLVLAALPAFAALQRLPLLQWTPPDRRERVRALRRRAVAAAGGVAALGFVLMVASAALSTRIRAAARTTPAVEAVLTVLSSPVVLLPLLALGALAALAAVAVAAADAVVDRSGRRLRDGLVTAGSGTLLAVATAPVVLGPGGGLVALVLVGPLGLFVLGLAFVFAVRLGLLPDRAAGPALAGVGLFVAAVGALRTGFPLPLSLAVAAGSLVVWDVSAFGLGLTAELGHQPDTRRLELYHAVVSVGVGVAAVAALTGLDWVLGAVPDVGATAAAAAAVVGVVLLTLPLAR